MQNNLLSPNIRVLVLFNQFLIGSGIGWTAPTLLKLKGPNPALQVASDQISWLVSLHDVGKVPGTFVAPSLADKIGRRFTLSLTTVLCLISWLCITMTRNIYLLYAARLVFGASIGIYDVVAGIYTAENTHPKLRGIIGSCIMLTHFGAVFTQFVVATYSSYMGTAIANTIFGVCAFVPLYFGTETPYFLIKRRRRRKAEKNLTWLSGKEDSVEVAEELRRIEQSVSEEFARKQPIIKLITLTTNLKAIILLVAIIMLGECSGYSVFAAYSSLIFSSSKTFTANEFTILYGAAKFSAVLISPFIIEKINRRSLILGCYSGMAFCNLCSFLVIYWHNNVYNFGNYPWFIFSSITTYNMFFAILSATYFPLKAEILPFSVRAIGSSAAVIGQSITAVCFSKIFFPITENFSMEWNFLIYVMFCLLAIVGCYFVLPETRGKTLYELQRLQRGNRVPLDELSEKEVEEKVALT